MRDLNYETTNIGYDDQYPEGGIKCKNYQLCESILPYWWFDCKFSYLCTDCHMQFGTWGTEHKGKGILEITDNIECPICLEEKEGISQPHCNHSLCIDCFKRCYYGEPLSEKPPFPYPEIEDEYDNDYDNPKWKNNYPLIKLYTKNLDNWYKSDEDYKNNISLDKCPLCRK